MSSAQRHPDGLTMDGAQEASALAYRKAIAALATGVTVITTRDGDGRPRGMTANAVTSLSLSPCPQLLVCISSHLPTHTVLADHGRFAVNVLSEDQRYLAIQFARPAEDKFTNCHVQSECDVPILSDAMAWFACDVVERFPGGDHTIFIGSVKSCHSKSGRRPLLFFESGFGSLADEEAGFAAAMYLAGM